MENRKLVRFSFVGIIILLTLQAHSALAYGVAVHAFLTDEVVDLYNKN